MPRGAPVSRGRSRHETAARPATLPMTPIDARMWIRVVYVRRALKNLRCARTGGYRLNTDSKGICAQWAGIVTNPLSPFRVNHLDGDPHLFYAARCRLTVATRQRIASVQFRPARVLRSRTRMTAPTRPPFLPRPSPRPRACPCPRAPSPPPRSPRTPRLAIRFSVSPQPRAHATRRTLEADP